MTNLNFMTKQPKQFICPNCKVEDTRIGMTQGKIVVYYYDIETKEYDEQDDYIGGEAEQYFCINCDCDLTADDVKEFVQD